MRDKELIEKIEMAYRVYEEKFFSSPEIERFIEWLYIQYGIEKKKKD